MRKKEANFTSTVGTSVQNNMKCVKHLLLLDASNEGIGTCY